MVNIILPKTLARTEDLAGRRVFFLAGPVRGAGDWQHVMAGMLGSYARNCVIAIPQRYKPDHALCRFHLLQGEEDAFPRQLAWEEHYLQVASRNGGIIFWLGCQKESRDDEDPYAMDTRREIGEWITRAELQEGVKIFLGIEHGFRGASQIERTVTRQLGSDFPIYTNMRDLARAAGANI